MTIRTARLVLVLVLAAAVPLAACGDNLDGVVVPPRPAYNTWLKIEPPGMVCGNGSQYKFFVNYSDTSNNVVVAFEPGGACWDYDSCAGKTGIMGAANVDGLPDDHYDLASHIVPFFQREYPDNVTHDWNLVYVPYCTGDVHTGNAVVTYQDPAGQAPDLTFHHTGHANVLAVVDWMDQNFQHVPKLLATGCSAGGAGSAINYYYLRKGMTGVDKSYLLSDSGPIFPSTGFSKPLHEKVYSAWNVGSILGDLPSSFDPANFGSLNDMLGTEFPDDRLAITFFRRDFNYSRYSYERFYTPTPDKAKILSMWWSDTQLLMAQLRQHANMEYYIPYWRGLNDSHCDTIISYDGAEIQEANMTLGKWIGDLLDDDKPLKNYLESPQAGEDL